MRQDRSSGKLRSIRQILYSVRWIIILGVYIESMMRFSTAHLDRLEIRIAVIVIAALTILSNWIPKKWLGTGTAVLSTMLDIGFVTVVIFFSDGITSPYYPLYYVTVISAATTLGTNGAIIAAISIAFLSFGVEVHDTHGSITNTLVAEDFVRTVPYLFLIAIITGALRDRESTLSNKAATLQAEHDIFEREMEIARRVERAQLPSTIPSPEGAEIAIYYEPAREVGGDTYDFYPVKQDYMGITIADASGKGIPAALLVSSTKYAIREHFSEDLSSMMSHVNGELLTKTTDDTFVTMVFGLLNTSNWEFRFINAGHMPPILIKYTTGEVISYEKVDPPLGITAIDSYKQTIIKLELGDTLIFCTDGVTDALAGEGDGLENFKNLLTEMNPLPLSDWKEYLRGKLINPSHIDDSTMLAIRIRK